MGFTIVVATLAQGTCVLRAALREQVSEYDIVSLFMVRFYCFVTKACARRPGAAASAERRRRERRTLLAGASQSDTLLASQAFERMHILWQVSML